MFDFSKLNPKPSMAAARQQVESLIRSRLGCHEHDHVLVQELNCLEPGCPPKETMIAIFSDGKSPVQFRIHKALSDINLDDLNALFEAS